LGAELEIATNIQRGLMAADRRVAPLDHVVGELAEAVAEERPGYSP
jgi:hypothetical protein